MDGYKYKLKFENTRRKREPIHSALLSEKDEHIHSFEERRRVVNFIFKYGLLKYI